MDSDDYKMLMDECINALLIANTLLLGVDDDRLKAAAHTVEMADSVGAIFDPTMYRAALGDRRLEKQRRIIALVRHIKAELTTIETLGA